MSNVRFVMTAAGVLVALVFIVVSAAMNVTFVSSLGRTAFESQLFGAVSLACDAAKALLPILCAHALRNGLRLRAAIGIGMFVLFTVTSFLSAVGFTAVNRMTVVKAAEDRTAQSEAIKKEIATIDARIATMPAHRPASVIAEALSASQLDRRWTLSKQCTDVTDGKSRLHCEGYFTLRAEHAAALEADKLDARRTVLKAATRATYGSASDTDAQTGIVASALDIERSTIQRALVLLMALIVELGSGLGLYLAWQPKQKPDQPNTLSDVPASKPCSPVLIEADAPTVLAEPAVDDADTPLPTRDPDIMRAVLRRPNRSSDLG